MTALETQVAPIAALVEQISHLAASIQRCQSTLAMLQSTAAAGRARPSRQLSVAVTPSISRSSSIAQPPGAGLQPSQATPVSLPVSVQGEDHGSSPQATSAVTEPSPSSGDRQLEVEKDEKGDSMRGALT
jgi:hypothetical protein